MAMNAATLKSAIAVRLKSLYRSEPPNTAEGNGDDYFLDQMAAIFAEEVIAHIQANAKCSGNDSRGDSHDNVGIV